MCESGEIGMEASSDTKNLQHVGEGRSVYWRSEENDRILEAAETGDIDTLVSISKKGIDVTTAHNMDGQTVLHVASIHNQRELLQLLIKTGIAVDVKDNRQCTALYWAAANGKDECVQLLCEAGAAVGAKNNYGATSLHLASQFGYNKVVKIVIDAGAKVDSKNNGGSTPLHLASYNGHIKTIEILMDAGATVDIKDNNGYTPLADAVRQGHGEVALTLVYKYKADITIVKQELQQDMKGLLKKAKVKMQKSANETSSSSHNPQQDKTEEKSNPVDAYDIMAYEKALKDGSEHSNQFKLVTLGAEGAGKTSSINTLLNLPFQANQNTTIGTSVNSCSVDTHLASSKWKKITALYRVTEIPRQYRREMKAAMSSVSVNPVTPAAPVRPVPQKVINEVESLIASKEEIPQDGHIRIVIFDIGGQEVYYDVHFLFLTIEDVALLVFDCSKDLDDPVISRHHTGNFGEKITTRGMQSNIETMELLLHSVYSRGQKAPVGSISPRVPVVIMLGTHAENVSMENQELIIQAIYQRFYGKLFLEHLPRSKNEAFHFLGNSNPDPKSVDHLRSTVLKAAELVITTKRPISYLKFEGKILESMQQAQVRLTRADAVNIARDAGVEGEQAVDALLQYFTNKGILLYYPKVLSLENEIFISPQEVSDLVCTVISTNECKPDTADLQKSYCRYIQYALLEEELLVFILQQSKRLKDKNVLLGLLDKFNLVTEVPTNTIFSHEITTPRNKESKLFIVPPLLVYDNKVTYHKQDGDIIVQFYFPDGFLPESVFNQLLVKTIQWCCKCKHIVRCIRRGVGYFSFDDARWQQFQLQLCQSTSSINSYITIQRCHQPPSDILPILLQQRQQLLIYLESSLAEVTKCCMPSAKPPVTHLECPLHEENCIPHVVININERNILVCHKKLLATPIPEEFYILLYQETAGTCLLSKLLKQKPKMSSLLKIVIPKVATHWDKLAYYLDFEISSVELIRGKCFKDPEKCCEEVFTRWLNSKEDISSKTWEILINALKEITDLTAVTEQIEKELHER